jgi:hypothetical protein
MRKQRSVTWERFVKAKGRRESAAEKYEGKSFFRIPNCKLEDNIKMNVKEYNIQIWALLPGSRVWYNK